MDLKCEQICESYDELLENIEINDLIEYNVGGEQRFAYYIGHGCAVLISSEADVTLIHGDGDSATNEREIIKIEELQKMEICKTAKLKYKIFREKIEWRSVDDVLKDAKLHDIIEVERILYRHFCIYTGNGNIVDLNPESALGIIGSPVGTSFFVPSTTSGDFFGVENGKPPIFANGVIEERPLCVVVDGKRCRIRDDNVYVDVYKSNGASLCFLEPLKQKQIEDRIEKAKKLHRTKYNVCVSNCEHFVMWVKFGVCLCSQTNRIKQIINPFKK